MKNKISIKEVDVEDSISEEGYLQIVNRYADLVKSMTVVSNQPFCVKQDNCERCKRYKKCVENRKEQMKLADIISLYRKRIRDNYNCGMTL